MALVLKDRVRRRPPPPALAPIHSLVPLLVLRRSRLSVTATRRTMLAPTAQTLSRIGTYTSSGTTLARTTILQSSNSDNAVNWSAGTRTIFCTLPAEKMIFNDANNVIQGFTDNSLAFAIALG